MLSKLSIKKKLNLVMAIIMMIGLYNIATTILSNQKENNEIEKLQFVNGDPIYRIRISEILEVNGFVRFTYCHIDVLYIFQEKGREKVGGGGLVDWLIGV